MPINRAKVFECAICNKHYISSSDLKVSKAMKTESILQLPRDLASRQHSRGFQEWTWENRRITWRSESLPSSFAMATSSNHSIINVYPVFKAGAKTIGSILNQWIQQSLFWDILCEENNAKKMTMTMMMMISAMIFGAPTAYQAHTRYFTFTISLNASNIPAI